MASEERSMSEDSVGYLEDVKKGKPRKFAMICKGTDVISLVVYKKGNVEKHRKEAKQSGRGQFYYGVVDGKGIDIRFVLARADGFDAEPVKSTKLKHFLEEAADLKCKPRFEILDVSPLVLDEDDPLVARFLALQATALKACEEHPDQAGTINTLCLRIGSHFDQDQPVDATGKIEELEALLASLGASRTSSSEPVATPSAAPSSGDANATSTIESKLIEALKRMKPLMDKAIALDPARKGDISAAVLNVREQMKSQQFTVAQQSLVALGKMLQGLVANAGTSAAPTTESKTSADGDPSTAFNQRLKDLLPAVKSVAGAPLGDSLKLLVSEAGSFARKKDFTSAHELLDQVQMLLNNQGSAEQTGDQRLRDELEALKLRVEPKLQQAGLSRPDKREALEKAWKFAADQAIDGKVDSAVSTLTRLEAAIDKLLSESVAAPSNSSPADTPVRSVVALQKSLLAWDAACKQMTSKLQELERAILALFADDARLDGIKQNLHKLDAVLGDYAEELRDRLDEAYNTADEFKNLACDDAMEVLGRYRNYLRTEPFIQAIDDNPVLPININGILGQTLDKVAANLGG